MLAFFVLLWQQLLLLRLLCFSILLFIHAHGHIGVATTSVENVAQCDDNDGDDADYGEQYSAARGSILDLGLLNLLLPQKPLNLMQEVVVVRIGGKLSSIIGCVQLRARSWRHFTRRPK